MKETMHTLIEDFYVLVNRMNQLKHTQFTFGGVDSINTASLHLIETIGNHEEMNTTELAEKLGVTKGAVSQMSGKLCRKGLLEKHKGKNNDKDVFLSLTSMGKNILVEHDKLHGKMYADLDILIQEFSEEDIAKIHVFLKGVSLYMDEYAKRLNI